MDNDHYSCGPFSRVFFVITRSGPGTFTYRRHREDSAGSLIHTLSSGSAGGPTFTDVFVSTDLLPAAR